jgi:hypothetical protein
MTITSCILCRPDRPLTLTPHLIRSVDKAAINVVFMTQDVVVAVE